ncbi:hypothetical protein [Pseudofrankia sp. BMG5.36]|uniref:hypothetical protein n=1 Tax=Pseudofrankia sp. BMG5.36 TaxID=1834512 RepID=UPI00104267D6|nr:hypothetical protein [Pseudofrankia sp. BMG5.36]
MNSTPETRQDQLGTVAGALAGRLGWAWIAGAASLFLLCIRTLSITGGNTDLAVAVLTTASPTQLILWLLLQATPVVIVSIFMYYGSGRSRIDLLIAGAAFLGMLALVPIYVVILGLPFLVLGRFLRVGLQLKNHALKASPDGESPQEGRAETVDEADIPPRGDSPTPDEERLARDYYLISKAITIGVALIVSLALSASFLFAGTFWLPKERIEDGQNKRAATGYVLDSTPAWTKMLATQPLRIEIFHTSEISKRTTCGNADNRWNAATLPSLLTKRKVKFDC